MFESNAGLVQDLDAVKTQLLRNWALLRGELLVGQTTAPTDSFTTCQVWQGTLRQKSPSVENVEKLERKVTNKQKARNVAKDKLAALKESAPMVETITAESVESKKLMEAARPELGL